MRAVYTPGNSPRRTRSAEAAVRKRERDRDCQRRKRWRERQYTESLEKELRELQSLVGIGFHAGGTECENVTRARVFDTLASTSHLPSSPPDEPTKLVQHRHLTTSETVTVSLQVLESCLAAPHWARVPLNGLSLTSDPAHCLRGNKLPTFIKSMRANTLADSLCPPDPKVIDLLYGGSKNILANVIVEACSKEPLLPPEKLATNLALYKYCRWLIWPSEENFASLPACMHPTAMQLTVEHQWCIDLVAWPEIRENMIRYQSSIDMDAAIGLFLCSFRIRGAFNTNIITRQNDGELEINPDFFRRFTDPTNWGLLETFVTKYPELAAGLSSSAVMKEQDLIVS